MDNKLFRHTLLVKVSPANSYPISVKCPFVTFCWCLYLILPTFETADAILESNLQIPLKGIAIGNGWMDPMHQYASFLPFMLQTGLLEKDSEVGLYSSVWFDINIDKL